MLDRDPSRPSVFLFEFEFKSFSYVYYVEWDHSCKRDIVQYENQLTKKDHYHNKPVHRNIKAEALEKQ